MPHALSSDAARVLHLAYDRPVRRTRNECAGDPLAAATRQAVIKFERQLHSDGWNTLRAPLLFRVDRHRTHNRVWIELEHGATASLHQRIAHHGERVGRALCERAETAEIVRAGGALPNGVIVPPWHDGDAVVPDDPSRVFYGYGMCEEQWFASSSENVADRKALAAFTHDRSLNAHPAGADARSVHLVCRDDRKWFLSRVRGAAPFVYCWKLHDEDGARPGSIFHALSRMTNAAADNPVSIVQSDPEKSN